MQKNSSIAATDININRNVHWLSRIYRDRYLYILVFPGLLFFIIFRYLPMFGVIIAFQNFNIYSGFLKSEFVGLKHFMSFFRDPYCWMVIRNTLQLNIYMIVFAFPCPIILALLINEVRHNIFKRFVQTVSYLPHFISPVIIVGMLIDFLLPSTGIIARFLSLFTGNRNVLYMAKPEYFKTIYLLVDIWKNAGWGTIIYMAALTNIDPTLYEASVVDGANRWQRIIHITIPGILPTIIILLILRVGYILDIGFEMVFLMQNSLNYNASEVISTYVYHRGIASTGGTSTSFSYATAIGLFKSVIGFGMIIATNKIARKVSDISLW